MLPRPSSVKMSPMTMKKGFESVGGRQLTEHYVQDRLEDLEQKIHRLKFTKNEETQLQDLKKIQHQLKDSLSNIRSIGQWLIELGEVINQTEKSMPTFSTVKIAANLFQQSEGLKTQTQSYLIKVKQAQTQINTAKLMESLKYKQQLSQKIIQFQKQVDQQIKETKDYSKNKGEIYRKIIESELQDSEQVKKISRKKLEYETILGMISAVKRNRQDELISRKVKERFERYCKIQGYKSKNSQKQMQIETEKKYTIQAIKIDLAKTHDQILAQANNLKTFIKHLENNYLQFKNKSLSEGEHQYQKEFDLAFSELEKLQAQIHGSVDRYQYKLQILQDTIEFSKQKTYFSHKDPQLSQLMRKFNEYKQTWLDFQRMLQFQFCKS